MQLYCYVQCRKKLFPSGLRFFLPFFLHLCNKNMKMEVFMQISDPMISEHGRVYSLAGMKRLLKAVTKNGGVVSVRKSKGKKIS